MDIELSPKQHRFITADANEVLYGGGAGGGKSWGQLYDAFLYALRHKRSKQLILRRTFPDLERSLIRVALELFPREVFRYNDAKHRGTFPNGSVIDFGYCDSERDVYRYQGAEYDTIRFDELTHFTESMYLYLISRLRGANDYPKQIKSSTNPGGVGHGWVKARFIDIGPWDTVVQCESGTRLFIPSLAKDNRFLMEKDPGYLDRLDNLGEVERRALKFGDWDIFAGQYFTEFRRERHVIDPFPIPAHWRRYAALDYGLDMLACYWAAFDPEGRGVIYRELYEPNLIVSKAAKRIIEAGEDVYATLAPADLWGRMADSGKSQAERFFENGLTLTRVAAKSRVDGWMGLKEWIAGDNPALRIVSTCRNLIRCLPLLQHDPNRPNDCAADPHEITHAPDAIRYLLSGRPAPNRAQTADPAINFKCERPRPSPGGKGDRVMVL